MHRFCSVLLSPRPLWRPQREGLHTGVWLKLELWGAGRRDTAACAAAPQTAAALQALPEAMLEAPGRAAFSLMMPGACVRPHCGPTNHRLRLHLPLLLPGGVAQADGLTVGGQTAPWTVDQCLVFDDSFEHEVVVPHNADVGMGAAASTSSLALRELVRVVLIVDLWHPDAAAAGLRPSPGSAMAESASSQHRAVKRTIIQKRPASKLSDLGAQSRDRGRARTVTKRPAAALPTRAVLATHIQRLGAMKKHPGTVSPAGWTKVLQRATKKNNALTTIPRQKNLTFWQDFGKCLRSFGEAFGRFLADVWEVFRGVLT